METLASASFHENSETLHLQGCGTADPCMFECCVNFDLKTFEMKTKHCNCIAKTKHNRGSIKTRKQVIVILHLPLQRYLTVTTKKLN